jgi:hypothetical protein
MLDMDTENRSLTQEMLAVLEASAEEAPEGYDGKEWIKAARLIAELDPPTSLGIPWCIFDLEEDEFGVTKMESKFDHLGRRKDLDEDGNEDPDWTPQPKRRSRNDALAILAWVPLLREDPELSLEAVQGMLHDGNIRELTRMVFKFWGVDVAEIQERLERLAASAEPEEQAPGEVEASEPVNFPE